MLTLGATQAMFALKLPITPDLSMKIGIGHQNLINPLSAKKRKKRLLQIIA